MVLLFAATNFLYKGEYKEILQLILEILIVIFSGFAGVQFMSYLNKQSAKAEIKLKATGAIRNLINIEDRLKNIIGCIKANSKIKEIENLVGLLQADVGNARDDWNDIVDIGEIDKYREKIMKAEQEKEKLLKKIDDDGSEKENLSEEVKSKDLEIEKIQEDFDNYKNINNLDTLGSVGISPSLGSIVTASYPHSAYICQKCNKPFNRTTISVVPNGNYLCEECLI